MSSVLSAIVLVNFFPEVGSLLNPVVKYTWNLQHATHFVSNVDVDLVVRPLGLSHHVELME